MYIYINTYIYISKKTYTEEKTNGGWIIPSTAKPVVAHFVWNEPAAHEGPI